MKKKGAFRDLLKNTRPIVWVYQVLRLLVVLTMVTQLLHHNYENVYICVLTLILFLLPSFIERKLHVELPDPLEIIILLFIFAAEILGEIQEYYLRIPGWDTVLHTINGFLFAAIGFSIVNILNKDKHTSMSLSPFYMAVTAFCFSMTIGILWEFFEWSMDTFFGLDMQKDTVLQGFNSVMLDPGGHNIPYHVRQVQDVILVYADGTRQALGLGGYLDIGLQDTMKDLLVNLIGAVVFSFFGYFYVKSSGQGKIAKMFIPNVVDVPEGEKSPEKKKRRRKKKTGSSTEAAPENIQTES